MVITDQELVDNFKKIDLSEEEMEKMFATRKGQIVLTAFIKYDPKTRPGLIPKIQINVRQKGVVDFQVFKAAMTQSAKSLKNYFDDFEFIQEPDEVEISGIKSVGFVGKFTMKTNDGQVLKARTRVYAIPFKNYFFQVNFTDGQVDEDCTEIFDELLKTIKIGS